MDPFTAESLTATFGLAPYLARKPQRLGAPEIKRAFTYGARLEEGLRAFLSSNKRSGKPELSEADYLEVLDRLSEQPGPQDVERLTADFGDQELAMAYVRQLGRALGYLQGTVPRKTRTTLVGAKPVPPRDLDLARFRRALAVVDDPMIVIRHMAAESLVRDEVKALQAVYPALHDAMKQILFAVISELVADDQDWEPTYARDEQLQVLLGTSTMTPGLARDIQQAYEQGKDQEQQQGPKGTGRPLNLDTTALQTPTQRIESR